MFINILHEICFLKGIFRSLKYLLPEEKKNILAETHDTNFGCKFNKAAHNTKSLSISSKILIFNIFWNIWKSYNQPSKFHKDVYILQNCFILRWILELPKWHLEIQVTLKLRGIYSKPEQNKEHNDNKEIYAKEFMKMSCE